MSGSKGSEEALQNADFQVTILVRFFQFPSFSSHTNLQIYNVGIYTIVLNLVKFLIRLEDRRKLIILTVIRVRPVGREKTLLRGCWFDPLRQNGLKAPS